jgi:ABC-type multidrug transport system fused ATPase/permease subunit
VYLFYKFELAAFLTFLIASYRMYGSFQEIQNTHYKMAGHVPSLEMYDETLSGFVSNQYPDITSGIEFQTLIQQITFNQVSFAYKISKSQFILGPVDLKIEKGKMVGLVGRSGSGKSTCVDLMVGLLRSDNGTIEIDGRTLFDYSLSSFRKKVAYVSQDIFLLNATIFKNIAFSDDSVTLERVKDACALAYATEFIEELPEKYQTLLGEHGTRLSGGQKQRIALARALVRKPEILILDEATSSLDNESEKQVQLAIDALSREMTIIVIAHRLSTVKNADYIYMFEDGKIIEEGTFGSLLEQRGKFFDLYTLSLISPS